MGVSISVSRICFRTKTLYSLCSEKYEHGYFIGRRELINVYSVGFIQLKMLVPLKYWLFLSLWILQCSSAVGSYWQRRILLDNSRYIADIAPSSRISVLQRLILFVIVESFNHIICRDKDTACKESKTTKDGTLLSS